jgi:5-oxoprolinase (ATP-hydrolysing)
VVALVLNFRLISDGSNLTFGAGGKDSSGVTRAGWGYYEVSDPPALSAFSPLTYRFAQTIAGGSGAGPGWHGTSGVHTHITNTRIGDPEILERRYPVLLHRFEIREGSGGDGEFCGGDGVIREFEFLQQIQVSMLSEVGVVKGVQRMGRSSDSAAPFKATIWSSRRRTRKGWT